MIVTTGKGYRKNRFGPLGLLCLTLVSVNTLMAFVPVGPKTTPVESPEASIEIITHLTRGEFTSVTNRFDEVLQQSLPPEKLKQVWLSLREQVGPYKRHIATQNRKRQQYNVVRMTYAFERSPVDIKVVYDPKGKITGLWFKPHQKIIPPRQYRIPAYADPAKFQEQQIKLETPSGSLPATITLPQQKGTFPVLVLIRGPQPYDLDSANNGNSPSRDFALGLACRGIVVLRYERSAPLNSEETNPPRPQTNQKDTIIQDARAAISYLRQMKQTDPKKIFISGHYLSGFAIPWILQTDTNLAGAIFQATPTRRLEDAYLAQMNYLFFLDGKISIDERRQLQIIKRQIQLVRNPNLADDHPGSDLPYGFPGGFWRELRESHPPTAVREMDLPLLILQGGRDYLTTLDDYRGWKKYLALRNNVDFKLYLRLNHFFMVGKGAGKSDPEELKMPDHVSEQVIEDIANWIQRK